MYEKNIVGRYAIRDHYPVFQHDNPDRRQVDPIRSPHIEIRDLQAARPEVSQHDALQDWEHFSQALRERRERKKRPTPRPPQIQEQKKAQAEVNAMQQAHVLEQQQVEPDIQQRHIQQVRQHLLNVRSPVPEQHTRIREANETEIHWVTEEHPGALLLGQVMTRQVLCLLDNSSLEQAAALCNQRQISGLPILNEAEKLVGVLSLKDILSDLLEIESPQLFTMIAGDLQHFQAQAMLQEPVSQHMTTRVITARPETPVQVACAIMHHYGIRRMLVTRDDQLLGIFTAQDAVRLLARTEVFIESLES